MAVLRSDALFFNQHNILDYSLLIGVHFAERSRPREQYSNVRGSSMQEDAVSPHGTPSPSPAPGRTLISHPSQPGPTQVPLLTFAKGDGAHDGFGVSQSGPTELIMRKPFHQRDYGGMIATDAKKILYFGIIDILTEWTAKKQAEFALRTVHRLDARGISCVHPKTYADRFVKAMDGHLK
eukprot:GHVN01019249.1.p1 GENE.GHVN01019249.1~~GHVN01019249.1.p1  ORF type:complete len:180 (-),score=28.57 GHVN01019249.1:339-878(-)